MILLGRFRLIILLVIFCANSFARGMDIDSTIDKGIKQIYSIQFDDAEKTFRGLIADHPENPAGRFFLAMIDWWRILIDLDNESNDDIFFQKLEDVIYQCDEILDNNPNDVNALFFKGGSIGFRGRLRAVRESWLKSADDGREALPIVQRASKLDPANKDVQLGFGIYNYYASVIPDKYPVIKPLMIFFPSGDKSQGLLQLKETAIQGKFAKYEAQYFLMTLYYQFEDNPYEAELWAKLLNEQFPNNPTFERWRGRIAVRRGDSFESYRIFSNVHDKVNLKLTGYNKKAEREAMYYMGLHLKGTQTPDSAIIYFEKCEELCGLLEGKTETGFLINTVLYLGMMYDAAGQRGKAVDYYNRVMNMREYGASRAFASEYLNRPFKF